VSARKHRPPAAAGSTCIRPKIANSACSLCTSAATSRIIIGAEPVLDRTGRPAVAGDAAAAAATTGITNAFCTTVSTDGTVVIERAIFHRKCAILQVNRTASAKAAAPAAKSAVAAFRVKAFNVHIAEGQAAGA
jgi:hypothetical protein